MSELKGFKRLKYLKQIKRKLWNNNPTCFVCKFSILDFEDCTTEHVVPRSLGGGDDIWNLAISHNKCNQIRKNTRCRLIWYQDDQIPKKPSTRQIYDLSQEHVLNAWKEKYLNSEEVDSENYNIKKNMEVDSNQ